MKVRPTRRGLKGRLLANSVDAFVLSIETINRLSVQYRVEAFSFLICNAWELLLKAKILDDSNARTAIYFPRKRGERRRTLALRDCVKRIYLNAHDPTRRNLERVADIRDEAVHLVIGQVPKDVLALFQACVLNFHRELGTWFGVSLSDIVPVGMMTLVYDLSPDHFDPRAPAMRRQLGRDAAIYLARLQDDLRREHQTMGESAEFSVVIDYRLATTKKASDADLLLTTGDGGSPVGIVHVPRDAALTHPHRQKNVVAEVNKALGGVSRIVGHDVQCVLKAHNIPQNQAFYHRSAMPYSSPQYSQAFVDWLVSQARRDPEFFTKVRAQTKGPAETTRESG